MKEKNDNDIELTNIENNCESNLKSEVKENNRVSFSERIRKLVTYLTVEPVFICYLLPSAIASLAVQQLNLEKACLTVLNHNETFCTDVVRQITNNNETAEVRERASTAVSDIISWQYPLQSGIPGIFILFVGAWSDRTGNRKLLLLLPIFGEIVSVSGLLLSTYYFLECPLWTTGLIEALPTALSGGRSTALMGAFSYIADITAQESRTFRIGAVAIIVTLAVPLGTAISGVLVQEIGYYGVFTIQLIIYIIGVIYTCLRINNVKKETTDGTFIKKIAIFFNPYNIWDTISLVIVTPWKQRKQVILVLCAHVLIIGPIIGEGSVSFLYAYNRYNMSFIESGLFSTYNILMGSAGTMVAIALFSKYLKINDSYLGIIATACKTISSVVYGWAPTRTWYYTGPAFDFFGNSGITAIRSMGTKFVDPDKVGKMCSLLALMESLMPIAYVPLYTKVYNTTIHTLPGAVFFLGSCMTVPAFFVFITILYINKKAERNVVKDPTAKERHTYDNDVTCL